MQEVDYSRHLDVKHWGNRTIPWKVCKAFSVIYETKLLLQIPEDQHFYISCGDTAASLLSESGVQLHDWQMQKKDARGIFAAERWNLWFHIWTVSCEKLVGYPTQLQYLDRKYRHCTTHIDFRIPKKSNCKSITMDW